MAKKKELKGALAEPIEMVSWWIILTAMYDLPDRDKVLKNVYRDDFDVNDENIEDFHEWPAMKEWGSILEEKRDEKYSILAREFEIDLSDNDGWKKLAKHLAIMFIPRFRISTDKKKRGAPRKFLTIYRDVEDMKNKDHSIKNACRILSKKKPEYLGVNPETLEQRYYEVVRQINFLSTHTFSLGPDLEAQLRRIRSTVTTDND